MEKTKKETVIGGGKHRVCLETDSVMVDDHAEDDVHAINFVNDFAEKLVSLFGTVCDQPFSVELSEFQCGEDEPHLFVSVDSIDDDGDSVVVSDGHKFVTHLMAVQYYMARNQDCRDENYAGKLEIHTYMYCPEASDGEEAPVENPMAYVLMNLVCMQYYRAIVKHYAEWQTDYMDAPTVVSLGFI